MKIDRNTDGRTIECSSAVMNDLGINAAIMLGALCYFEEFSENWIDDMFSVTRKEIQSLTALSPARQREGLKALEDAELVECRRLDVPSSMYYRVNEDIHKFIQ